MQTCRLIGSSKLPIGINVSMNGYLSLCVIPVMNWQLENEWMNWIQYIALYSTVHTMYKFTLELSWYFFTYVGHPIVFFFLFFILYCVKQWLHLTVTFQIITLYFIYIVFFLISRGCLYLQRTGSMSHVVSAFLPMTVRVCAESSNTQANILLWRKLTTDKHGWATSGSHCGMTGTSHHGNCVRGTQGSGETQRELNTHTQTHTILFVYKHASYSPFCGGNMQIIHSYTWGSMGAALSNSV